MKRGINHWPAGIDHLLERNPRGPAVDKASMRRADLSELLACHIPDNHHHLAGFERLAG